MSRPNVWAGKSCVAEGCGKPAYCRGLCRPHYTRARRKGTPISVPRPSFAEVARTARADAVVKLVNAGLLPKSIDPRHVCEVLGLVLEDLHGVLRSRRGWEGPRANVDRSSAPRGTKWCSKCKRWRPLDAFHRDKTAVDGRAHACRTCKNLATRAYRRRLKRAS